MKLLSKISIKAALAALIVTSGAFASPLNDKNHLIKTQNEDIQISKVSDKIFKITQSPSSNTGIDAQPLTISLSDYLTARFNPATGELDFLRPSGSPLLRVFPKNSSDYSFIIPQSSYLYGAGERGHSLTLNGDTLSMYNRQNYGYTDNDPRISQMGISIPMIASDNGFVLFFDDHARASLILGDTIKYQTLSPSPVSYYVMAGDNLAEATTLFTDVTGRQPLPPLWSLGYITSKYGYHNQAETLGVIDTLKNQNYPVDGIVLDLYWYGKETDMGRLSWMPSQWPDHQQMLTELKEKGVNTVLITQPYINKIGAIQNYNTLDSLGMLVKNIEGKTHDVTTWVGEAGMLDVSNPETQQWIWNRLKPLTAEGVAGWWGDLGEPEVHPLSAIHANGLSAELYHNRYGNDWSQTIYNGLRSDFPEMRPMLMMRGGSAGLQRFGVMPWTTDVSRTWGGLQPQVKLMLSSGISGLGYMSSDLGGFAVDPELPDDPELYARWLQFGAFTPVMRTHAQKTPEPYNFPTISEITHKYINMRYQWLPYNYSLAIENTIFGWPLARPLNFRGDNPGKKYADINDEYLWGDQVLVAPVLTQGATSRKITFPNGEWINWWNPAKCYRGGKTAKVNAPLGQLPLFIKAGSFIALSNPKEIENTSSCNPKYLTLRYFPSDKPSSTTLYDDDRTSPESIEKGEYQKMIFSASKESKKRIISLKSEGKYPGMPRERVITLQIENQSKAPSSVRLRSQNGVLNVGLQQSPAMQVPQLLRKVTHTPTRNYTYSYDPENHTLTILFPWGYSPTRIEIE